MCAYKQHVLWSQQASNFFISTLRKKSAEQAAAGKRICLSAVLVKHHSPAQGLGLPQMLPCGRHHFKTCLAYVGIALVEDLLQIRGP